MLSGCYYIFGAILVVISPTNAQTRPTDAFSGFFPCLPNNTNITTQEDVQSCDIFLYPAAQLAFERAQMEINDSSTRLVFESILSNGSSSTDVLYDIYVTLATLEVNVPSALGLFRGAVGPQNDYETSNVVLSVTRNINNGIPMVSYGLTDVRLNSYDNFYRTLPSTYSLNQARLLILAQFKWFRIGILGSQTSGTDYTVEMNSFAQVFKEYVERELEAELSYEGFIEDLPSTLTELRRLDLRIILGFFGPEQSREVLCEASSPLYKLTSPQHVWILPSYYNPDWWKDGNSSNSSCTDNQMRDILQSVIFVDPVKYPPLGTRLASFYPDLLNMTWDLYPHILPDVQLDHLLQHSRAISAYDATLLLIRSLDNGRVNQTKLISRMLCELCRIFPEEFLPETGLEFCNDTREMCNVDPANINNVNLSVPIQSIRQAILAGYGQVLISQFVDGINCPIMMFWPSESSEPEKLTRHFQFVHNLGDLINPSSGLRKDLEILTLFPGSVRCPKNFTWKGANAPQSNSLQYSNIPVWTLVLVGLVIAVSEILIAGLITFSIFWRENSHVKGTSPKLNIVILIGAALTVPRALFDGIIVSGTRYSLDPTFGTVMCQFNLWLPSIGETLFVSGILVKTYRLYRIFHNKTLKIKMKHLNDRDLIIAACLCLIPVVLALVVWNAVSPHVYKTMNVQQSEILEYVTVTSCTRRGETVATAMFLLILVYQFVIPLTAVCLSLFIHRAPRTIKLDMSILRITLGVGIVFIVIGFSGLLLTNEDHLQYTLVWTFMAMLDCFSIMVMVPVLFLYQVVLVARDYYWEMREKHWPKQKKLQTYHQQLLTEIAELTESITQKEATIRALKVQREVLNVETQV